MSSVKTMCRTRITVLFFRIFFVFILAGCVPTGEAGRGTGNFPTVVEKGGQISLFLNIQKPDVQRSKIQFLSIEVLSENSIWIPLTQTVIEATPDSLQSGQMFLTRSYVPVGYYSKLRIETAAPSGAEEPSVTEMEINRPLYVAKGDSHSMFLTWDIVASLDVGKSDKPVLSLNPQLKNMLIDVAYVACPDINTVYMICTDKNRICDSLGVPGRPTYLAHDPIFSTTNLYSITERDRNLKIIGPAANRVEAGYAMPTLGKGVQFTISPYGKWAFVVDRKRGNILRLDLRSGAIDLGNRLQYEPSYIIYLEKQALVAVSLSRSQTVVLLDPQTLNQVQAISTGKKPQGMLLFQDRYLYIAESGGNSVMVYDLVQNVMLKRISVGMSPERLLAVNNSIYVTNSRSRSLSLIKPGQLGISKTIRLAGNPGEIAYSSANKWIYVGNSSEKTIDIVNPANDKMTGQISLGAAPLGIAVLH